VNEDTGRLGGYHTEHWNGAQDATVRPSPVKMKLFPEEG
jgi:hypothetical protein